MPDPRHDAEPAASADGAEARHPGWIDADWEHDVERAHTPMGRAIMRVLSERGHYEEDQDGFLWAQADAGVTVRYIEQRGYTIRNVYDALLDTGLHGEPCPCLQADVEAIGAAL